MKSHKDRAIILSRVNYGERDRILTLLGAQTGKVAVLAKGARSEKSRLAGGIELLCESDISFVDTHSNLKTLTGARLRNHYIDLLKDVRRMKQAFDYLQILNKISEDTTGQEFYEVLLAAMSSLNETDYDPRIVDIWFCLQILKHSGSVPSLKVETTDKITNFEFDYENQQFAPKSSGAFTQNDLKLLRICLTQSKPPMISKELGSEDRLQTLCRALLKMNVTEV